MSFTTYLSINGQRVQNKNISNKTHAIKILLIGWSPSLGLTLTRADNELEKICNTKHIKIRKTKK